jgi:hypothetical protein
MFDWGLLQSLTLRSCEGWENFLIQGSGLSCPTRLKSLEIRTTRNEEIGPERTIAAFLDSFQGLEELFISKHPPSDTLIIWNALEHHKTTLRAFVHHQRSSVGYEDTEDFEEYENQSDNLDLCLTVFGTERAEWSRDRTKHPFHGLDLTFLGLFCRPDLLLV